MISCGCAPKFNAAGAIAVGILLAGCSVEVRETAAPRERTIPLPKAVAFTPAVQAETAKAEQGVPVRDGTVVRCLNKEFTFNPASGSFRITADGVLIADSSMPQRGSVAGNSAPLWMSPNASHPETWSREEKRTANGISCTYTLNFQGVRYVQSKVSVELLANGLIRIEKEGFPSPNPEKLTLNHRFYQMFCREAWAGTHYGVKGNPSLVPSEAFEAKVTSVPTATADGDSFTYCPNDPARRFTLTVEKTGAKSSFNLTHFDHFKKKDELRAAFMDAKAVFTIDIRTGVRRKRRPDERARVDFRRFEAIQMPDDTHRNLLPNGSFECGYRNWSSLDGHEGANWYDPKKWDRDVFRLSGTGAFEGSRALSAYAADPIGKMDIRRLSSPYPGLASAPLYLGKGTYTVSFSARGTKGGTQLGLWIPHFRYGNSYLPKDNQLRADGKYVKFMKPTTAWQRYTHTFKLEADDVTWVEFTFAGTEPESRIELDAVQLERGAAAHDYAPALAESRLVTSDPGNFCDATKPLAAKLEIVSARPNAKGRVRVEARTFLDETVFDRTYDYATDADRRGTLDLADLDAELPPRGLFTLKRTWTSQGDSTFEYDRLERVEYCGKRGKWDFLSNDYGSQGLRWDMKRYYDRYRKCGMHQSYHTAIEPRAIRQAYEREGIANDAATMVCRGFRELVPDPAHPGKQIQRAIGFGVGHFDQNRGCYDHCTNKTERMHLYLLNHKAYGLKEPDAAYLAKFRDACAAKTRDYPEIRLWEFANEFFAWFDVSWWNEECDREKALRTYAKYLKAYYEGVKSANPAAEVHADAPCNMGDDGIGQFRTWGKILAEEGVRMDGISFHTYRHAPENPDFDTDLKTVFSLMKEYGYPETTKLYFGEGMHWGPYEIPAWGLISDSWGAPPRTWKGGFALSYDIGQTERRAAAWRARSWLVDFKYAPRISQACAAIHNTFAMDLALTPFLDQLVANTLMHLLGNADFVADVRFAPYTRAFVFRDERERPVVAVWNHKEDVDYGRIAPPVAAADFGCDLEGVYDMMYTPREVPTGRFEFPLLPTPLFFRGKPGTTDAVLAAIRKACIVNGSFADRYSVAANPSTPDRTAVALKDNATGIVSNYTVAIRQPLVANRPTNVQLRKEGISYEGLVAKSAPVGATLATLDWTRYPQVPLGNAIGRPGKGFQGFYRLAWNPKGLFVEVDVRDGNFCHVLTKDPQGRWANDSVQVFVDAYANARANTARCYDTDDYEYSVFPEPDGSRCRVFRVRQCDWQLGLATSAPKDLTFADDMPTEFAKTANGYRYRVYFPAKYLLPLKLAKGSVVGLGIAANDANDPKAPDKVRRVGQCCNSTVSGKECFNRPYLYPAVLLWD